MVAVIPSPPFDGFHLGPFDIRVYGLMYVVGITAAVLIARRRWAAVGVAPHHVVDMAMWAVPAGIVGGRLYFDVTTPQFVPDHWWGPLAVWDGGLGIWGGVALATVVGIWRLRRLGLPVAALMDATAPAILVAQAIGRIGNYFNQELFGGPTTLPWALAIDPAHRPVGYERYVTFHPTFMYELIFDLLLAVALIALGNRRRVRPPGLFALYVTGYAAFRLFEESLRIDPAEHVLGLRLNFYVAGAVALAGVAWYAHTQRGRLVPRPRHGRGIAALILVGAAIGAMSGCGQGDAAQAPGRAHPAQHDSGGTSTSAPPSTSRPVVNRQP